MESITVSISASLIIEGLKLNIIREEITQTLIKAIIKKMEITKL